MSNERPDPAPASPPPHTSGGWSLPALFIGVAVTLVMTVYPFAAAKTGGAPDMLAASLLFWAMSAGFVRGLGFIPRLLVLRLLLSLPASLIALAAAIWRLASN
jgi:predicted membrane protein